MDFNKLFKALAMAICIVVGLALFAFIFRLLLEVYPLAWFAGVVAFVTFLIYGESK